MTNGDFDTQGHFWTGATLRSNLTETKRKIAKAQTVHFCAQ